MVSSIPASPISSRRPMKKQNEEESVVLSVADWKAEGEKRFGSDMMQWKFVCPSCGHVASVQEWKDAGAPAGAVAFSCVGRWKGGDDSKSFKKKGGPCMYAGGGLIGINPVKVKDEDKVRRVFEFAQE